MKPELITVDQFLGFNLSQISQTYIGKDAHCRCGCGGEYTSTSYHVAPRSPVNDQLSESRLTRAKRLIKKGNRYEIGSNNINISTGQNRALTLYFDEVN